MDIALTLLCLRDFAYYFYAFYFVFRGALEWQVVCADNLVILLSTCQIQIDHYVFLVWRNTFDVHGGC